MTDEQEPGMCFERVLAVITGERLGPYTAEQRKMVTVVVSPDAADVRIDRAGLTVQYPYRRVPFAYYPNLAAPMLSALLELAPISPCSFRVAAAQLSTICVGVQPSARWFWIRVSNDAIVVISRYAFEAGPVPPAPIPVTPWRAARKLLATFEPAVTCPNCLATSRDMRVVDSLLICPRCGRSWNPPSDFPEAASIHEAG